MPADSRDNLPAMSGSVTNYLCLAPEDKAKDALSVFNEIGIYLFPDIPASTAEAHSLAKQGTLALTLAYMPDPARAGDPLSPALELRSVLFPPLVVLVDRAPSLAEQEALRIQGVAFILLQPPELERDAKTLRMLARSSSWLSAKIERMPLPDVLQTMAVHNQSGMVSIACKHMRFHSTLPWKHNQKLCRARSGSNRECPGWYGRLYVRDGMLIHAETPSADGVPALAQLLRATAGSVRIHEVFILPQEPNITGSMHSNLLNAAWVADEDARNAPPSIPAPSVPGWKTSPHSTGSPGGSMPASGGAVSSRAEGAPRQPSPEPAPKNPPAAAKAEAGQPLSIDFDLLTPRPANAAPAPAPSSPETTGPVAPFEPGQILSLTDFELTFPSSNVTDEPLKKRPAEPPKAPLQQAAEPPKAPLQQAAAAPPAAAPKPAASPAAAAPAAPRPIGSAAPPAAPRPAANPAPPAAPPKEAAGPPPAEKPAIKAAQAAAPTPAPQAEKPAQTPKAAAPAPAPQAEKPAQTPKAAAPAPAAAEAAQPAAAPKPNPPRPATRPFAFARRPAPEVTVIEAPPLGGDKSAPANPGEPAPAAAPPAIATPPAPAKAAPLTGNEATPVLGVAALPEPPARPETSAGAPAKAQNEPARDLSPDIAPKLNPRPITGPVAVQSIETPATPKAPAALPLESPAERAVETSTPKGTPPMAGFDALLKAAPDLRAVAKADKGGNVHDMAGDADAETVCAVVALALKSLDEVEELVGLGNMRSWTIASSKVTLYVQHQPDGFVAALGGATKNAEATMRIVTEHAAAGAGGRR